MKKALFLAFALFTFFFTTSLLAVTTPIYWQSDASGTTCSASAAAVCYAPMNRSMPGGQMQEQSVVDANAWHMNVTTNSSIFLYDTNISGSAELTFFCNSTNRGGLLADIYTVTLYNMSGSPIGPSGAYTQLLSYAPAVGAASSTTSKNCTYDGAGVASQKNYPLGTVASTTILKPGDSLRLWINGTVLTAAASNYLYMIWGGNTQANLTIQESIRNGTLAANVSGPVSDQTIPSTGTASFNATVWCQNGGSCVNISTTVYMCSDAGAGCNPSAIVPLAGTVYADSSNKGVGYLTSANTSANISYTITSSGATVGTVYRFKFGANSTENEISQFKNSSIIRNFTIANIPPGYSSNSTNSTLAGAAISHSLYWTDNSGLSGYIFSFDNGTGTFVNDSFVQMLGNGNWSSVTKTANSTANATIRWIVYANNTNNFWNASLAYSYVTSAPPAPYTGWWNSSWQYRKPITINGSTSALTDYQVGYNITYATGINANFSDLRFTYYNATTATEAEIPYWIESNATASWAYVWFKTNLTTGNNKVYMYYGNSGASIASNGTNAFILFDHFNDGVYTDKWVLTRGSANESGTEIRLTGNSNTLSYDTGSSQNLPDQCWKVRGRITALSNYNAISFALSEIADFRQVATKKSYWARFEYTATQQALKEYNAGVSDTTIIGSAWTPDTNPHMLELCRFETNYSLYFDNSFINSSTSSFMTTYRYLNLNSDLFNSGDGYYDWIIVRKYTSPEPNVLSLGAEEATIPFVQIILPQNITYNSTSKTLNYTATSVNPPLNVTWYQYNGVNTTLTGNITFTALNNQASMLILYANNSEGRINSTSVTFTVDTAYPQIMLNLPANNSKNLPQNLTFNFTVMDNLALTANCSIYIDNILNQTNSSVFNNTITGFVINNITEGLHQWNVSCSDNALNTNFSATRNFTVNVTPILTSVYDSPDPIKGGNVVTITASGIDDPNNDTLNFYCSESSVTPNSTNTACTGGTTTDTTPPYALSCTYATAADNAAHTTSCRVYDGKYYSNVSNTTYTTDSTPPQITINNVAGDPDATYYDTADDGVTNITIDGESGMACRYSTSDLAYSGMSNDCTVTGAQAVCSPTTTNQGLDAYNFYVSCKDSLDNEHNSTQNTDIISLVHDWTAPTTTDNSTSDMQAPPYIVNITEQDNLFGSGSIETKYCIDTLGNCTPNTIIDSGETITFTSSNRGTNFLRYNSTDFNKTTNIPGNIQAIQNKTIRINRLPVFTSADDNATAITGGSVVFIATNSSEPDGQTLKLFVCNSTSVSSAGCAHTTYCSNTTGSANSSCSFTAENDDAAHTWFAYLYDSLNESAAENKSGTYTTDSSFPQITISYPENITYTQSDIPTSITTDKASDWSAYSLDGAANVSMNRISSTSWSKTILGVPDGFHSITFYANDTSGNMNVSAALYFTVSTVGQDTTPPTITITSPSNSSYQPSQAIWINMTTDENAKWAGFTIDGGAMQNMSNTSQTEWYNLSVLADEAQHNITVYANDTSNNRGNKSVSFYVDTKPPLFSLINATPNPANQSQDVLCAAYWTDMVGIASGKVAENASGSFTNHTIAMSGIGNWTNYTISGSSLSVGIFGCKFYATDLSGNENATETNFTVQDVIFPTINILYPENITYTQSSVPTSITISEAANWSAYSLDGAANVSMNRISSTSWSKTILGVPDGFHSITFYANDTSGNMNVSAALYFTVSTVGQDTTPPTITITSPSNSSYQPSQAIWINMTTDENAIWAGFTLNGGAMQNMSNTSQTEWYNLSVLADEAQHNITVYANDTSNNRGNKSVSFYVDTKPPLFSLINATPNPANQSQPVTCSAYWTDTLGLASGKVAENASGSFANHTIAISGTGNWTNYTISGASLSLGTTSCIFYATDSAGNTNSTQASFAVQDVIAPEISILYPENITYTQSSIPSSITISEAANWSAYSLDGAANVSMNRISSTSWSKTILGVPDGFHSITFYANDTSGNMNVSAALYFTVSTVVPDTTPPSIIVISPLNSTYLVNFTVLFNISLDENGNWAGVSINSTANQSMGNNTNLNNWNLSAVLPNGRHNATIYANDSAGNMGKSSVIFFAVDTRAPQNSSQGFEPSDANDTVDVKCFSFWTDNVELSHGFVEDNATGTPRNSSQMSLSGTGGSLNKTISASDTIPGILQCKVYAFDKANNANTTAFIINLTDKTNPIVENISYAPTSADDLDPNVTLNVTANITDNVEISAALIQYKLANATDFINETMNLPYGNRYNGSFTPDTAGNWSFRILATDTSGNQNISPTTNLTIEFDKTWSKTTNIPSTKAIVKDQNRFFSLGNLTVTNTADEDLNFTVTSAQTYITFNGTGGSSIDFIVNRGGNITSFNVTANTTGFAVGTYNYTVAVSAYTINPSLVSTQNITGIINIQNVPGPSLTVSIDAYSSTVAKGQTNITLTAFVRNQGSDDAPDTWLAWSIPSDWSLTAGTLNKSLGFLGIGQSASNSIIVSIGSSAPTGTVSISSSSNSSKGGDGSDTKSVTVGTPTTVTQTITQTTTTGGGGSTVFVGSPRRELLLQSQESFEIIRGLGDMFPIKVTNPFPGSKLENVTLQISGFLARYIKIFPDTLGNISFNNTKHFNVTIIAPTYTAIGTFSLNLTIKGVVITGSKTEKFTENRIVTLEIHAAGKEETNATIIGMEKITEELSGKGFGVNRLNRLLDRSKQLFEKEKYDDVLAINEEMEKIKDAALQSSQTIDDVRRKINEAEENFLSVARTKKLLNMATAAFGREDYEVASQRAHDAQLAYAAETSGKFSVLKFIIDYWHYILVISAIAAIAAMFSYRRMLVGKLTRNLRNLDIEEASLLSMVKDIQKKAFVDKSVGMETYGEVVRKCEGRLAEIKQLRTKMRTKRMGIVKISNELAILENERKEILKNIESLEDAYLNKGIVSNETYEKRSEQYLLRKIDLQKETSFLEAKLARERKGALRLAVERTVNMIVGLMLRISVRKVDKT